MRRGVSATTTTPSSRSPKQSFSYTSGETYNNSARRGRQGGDGLARIAGQIGRVANERFDAHDARFDRADDFPRAVDQAQSVAVAIAPRPQSHGVFHPLVLPAGDPRGRGHTQ